MSYEIIRSLRIKNDKVLVKADSNNVYPKDFSEREWINLTEILKTKGKDYFNLEVFKAYESGAFQKGQNKWVRALKILLHLPEYEKFNWRNRNIPFDKIHENRLLPEFEELLKKVLKMKMLKDKYIAIKKNYEGKEFYGKVTKTKIIWYDNILKSTKYSYEQDVLNLKKYYTGGENIQVKKIK